MTCISVESSLGAMDILLILRSFTSDNLFLKTTFDLILEPFNFDHGLVPRVECVVVPALFTADLLLGPNKRTLSFSAFFLIKDQSFRFKILYCLY